MTAYIYDTRISTSENGKDISGRIVGKVFETIFNELPDMNVLVTFAGNFMEISMGDMTNKYGICKVHNVLADLNKVHQIHGYYTVEIRENYANAKWPTMTYFGNPPSHIEPGE